MKKQIIDDMEIYSHFSKPTWFQRNEVNLLKATAIFIGLMVIAIIIAQIILLALNVPLL